MDIWNKRLSNLIKIKSIVTLGLLGLVIYLEIKGIKPSEYIIGIFTTCVGFYFGTQANKNKSTEIENTEEKK